MSTEPPSSPDHTLAKGESESEIDARMGGPPTRIKADGTRIYQQPMLDGKIRITAIYPDGSEETFKGVTLEMAKKMRASPLGSIPLVNWALPATSLPRTTKSFDAYLSQQAAQRTEKQDADETTTCSDAEPSSPTPSVTERRKKTIAIGWLIICAASILNESHDHYWGTPSLSWLVLLCATWALIVWLFPENAFGALKNWRRSRLILKRRRLLCRIAELKKASRINDQELQLMLLNAHPDSKAFSGCDLKGTWRKLPMRALLAIESSLETMVKLYVFNARKLKKKIESGAIPEWFADRAARVVFRRENAKWHELPCQKLAELPELWRSADANPDNQRRT